MSTPVNPYRSHLCSELRASDDDSEVRLSGWVHRRRDHGGLIFIDLRDRYGLTQIVFDPEDGVEAHQLAETVRPEWVISVVGKVRKRPDDMKNPRMATGEIEVIVNKLAVISQAKTPPFEIDSTTEVNEEIRLKYRYLDLRRERMIRNLILRSDMTNTIRAYFQKAGYLDVETPIMIKGTPEGSREYLVPSRLHAGSFYVLPQSPQQLKQLLMVGGIDKYFQIARCFRDEDQRGDRQPEFTQFEIESSFSTQEEIIQTIEKCFVELTEKHAPDKSFPKVFPRMSYDEAMRRYGSDKPDTRFGMEFVDLSDIKAGCGFSIFENVENLFALKLSKSVGELTRKDIDGLTETARKAGAGGLAWIRIGEESGPVAKNSNADFLTKLKEKCEAEDGDLVLFGAGEFKQAVEPLGEVRLAIGDKFDLRDPNKFNYLWVYDFPMFEVGSDGGIGAQHHPFTRPLAEDIGLLKTDPLKARAEAFDIVLNGTELGGGSMRIHEPELQAQIFDVLQISREDAESRFGHLIHAFEYGAPPHGGCAMGLDRVVMLFADEPNIREVMAFPKNQSAQDLMLGAPAPMPADQVAEANVKSINLED